MEIIFEDNHFLVVHAPGVASNYAVATFGTRDERPNGVRFWGDVLARKHGIECFGFVPKSANWFPYDSMRKSLPAIQQYRSRPIIGYGHSMGGYAAIKYSGLLKMIGSVASGPQFSIDPSDAPWETRYSMHYRADLHADMQIKSDEMSGRSIVAYDPYLPEDRKHADYLSTLSPTVERLPLPHMLHRTVAALKPGSVLIPIFQAILDGSPISTYDARQARRLTPYHFTSFARFLLAKDKPKMALLVLSRMPETEIRESKIERALFLSRALTKTGALDSALEAAESVHGLPDNHTLHLEAARIRTLRGRLAGKLRAPS